MHRRCAAVSALGPASRPCLTPKAHRRAPPRRVFPVHTRGAHHGGQLTRKPEECRALLAELRQCCSARRGPTSTARATGRFRCLCRAAPTPRWRWSVGGWRLPDLAGLTEYGSTVDKFQGGQAPVSHLMTAFVRRRCSTRIPAPAQPNRLNVAAVGHSMPRL